MQQELDEKGRLHNYEPLHADVYEFSADHFEPALMDALREGTREALLGVVVDSPVFGVFRFPCMKPAFCARLVEELDHLERSGRVEMARPNSMNRYGAILDQCGFRPFMNEMCARIIFPMADAFFASSRTVPSSSTGAESCADVDASKDHREGMEALDVGGDDGGGDGDGLDGFISDANAEVEGAGLGLKYHHAFTVRYAPREDAKLAKHVDNSDITLNVCLGREGFKGGHLLFQGCKDTAVMRVPKKIHRYAAEEQEHRVDHEIGMGLIHLGSHIHQAVKVEEGERINLIVWNKAEPF